jgi:hypothetical protein
MVLGLHRPPPPPLPSKQIVSVVNWFDPNKLEHLQAYQVLNDTGLWPEHFIPADVRFPVGWAGQLNMRLADLYVNEKVKQLTGKVLR